MNSFYSVACIYCDWHIEIYEPTRCFIINDKKAFYLESYYFFLIRYVKISIHNSTRIQDADNYDVVLKSKLNEVLKFVILTF